MRRLEGRSAVVTGSSSGIGKAIALGFAAEGCSAAADYRGNEPGAADTLSRIEAVGGRAFAVRVDVGNPREVDDIVPAELLRCSPEGAYITGQVLGIDGGREIALNGPYRTGFEE